MPHRVVDHDRVLRAAERMFDADGGVDMEELSRRLGISRATLYRVVGSRERLLGDVLWWQGQRLMDHVAGQVTAAGAERLVQLARAFNERLIAYPALRRFLRSDPVLAHHVLFLPEARVHSRFVALWRELLVGFQKFSPITRPGGW